MSLTGIIDAIYTFCQNAMQIMGYPGLALVMFLENVFPPIPSEIVLPVAGTLTVSSDPAARAVQYFPCLALGNAGHLCRCMALVLGRLSYR